MSPRIALICGVTGQDGAYLAELLLNKGYIVHGIRRRSSCYNMTRIENFLSGDFEPRAQFFLHYGDVTDASSLATLIGQVRPTELYNLAAQSDVHASFGTAEYTGNT